MKKKKTSIKMTSEKDFCTKKKTLLENIDIPRRRKSLK